MFEKDKGTLSNVEFGLGSQSLIIDVLGNFQIYTCIKIGLLVHEML